MFSSHRACAYWLKDALDMLGSLAKWFSKRGQYMHFVKDSQEILIYNQPPISHPANPIALGIQPHNQ